MSSAWGTRRALRSDNVAVAGRGRTPLPLDALLALSVVGGLAVWTLAQDARAPRAWVLGYLALVVGIRGAVDRLPVVRAALGPTGAAVVIGSLGANAAESR